MPVMEVSSVIMKAEDAAVVAARQYILEHPPKRQVWVNNAVDWEQVANVERSPQMLFVHIRRVRNNLYHGGKFNGRWIDPDRSKELIGKALLILQTLERMDSQVSEAIPGNSA
jgi:hypothetical protein